jgi:cellulose synthase/poly-beta-1,6-N-acetylglucosamine synthase-like glycosyltransferase
MAPPVIIILLISYFYILLILLFFLEIEKHPERPEEIVKGPLSLSIIIPFKNEALHLLDLVNDLIQQDYPAERWEVLFVDDHSTDGSASRLESIFESEKLKKRSFSVLSLPADRFGKKAAISFGIGHAEHERIVQVDADCRLGPRFISSHMSFLQDHPSELTAGMVTIARAKGNFLEAFERLDFLSLVGIGAGSFNLGRPVMCSGANLSYSKELYRETRIFDPEDKTVSGDDMFLMIGARKLGRSLTYNTNRESMVETMPVKDLRALIVQRIRWGSKATRYRMPDIQLLALLTTVSNVAIFLMPLWLVLFSGWWPWLLGAWLLKTLAEFMLLYRITGITGQRSDLKFFLPVSLVYYPVFMVTMTGALLGKSMWKGGTR